METEPQVKAISSLPLDPGLVEAMQSGRMLGFDVETHVEDWHTEFGQGPMVCWQVFDAEANTTWVVLAVPCPVTDVAVREWLEGPAPKAIHNAAFEAKVLAKMGVRLRNPVDTMLMARAVSNGVKWDTRKRAHAGASLAELVKGLYDVDIDADKATYQLSFKIDQATLTPGQVAYAAADAYWTRRLADDLADQVAPVMAGVRLDQAVVPYLERVLLHGIPIDRGIFDTLMADAATTVADAEKAFFDLPATGGIFATVGELNMDSPEKVREALDRMGLPLQDLKKETVAKCVVALKGYTNPTDAQKIQLTALELHTRRISAVKLLEWRDRVDGDDRIRSRRSSWTNTGRLTTADHNILSLPRELRAAVVAPPGQLLVGADYSQQELRVGAVVAPDAALAADLSAGVDRFSVVAAELGIDRSKVKTGFYSALYGAGIRRVADATGLSAEAAKALLDRLAETYPDLFGLLRSPQLVKVTKHGLLSQLPGEWLAVSTPTRRRLFPSTTDRRMMATTTREAGNFGVQATAADMSKLALGKICKRLDEKFPSAAVVLFLHDEFLVTVAEADAPAVEDLVRIAMTEAYTEVLGNTTIPCEIGGGVARSYGEIK